MKYWVKNAAVLVLPAFVLSVVLVGSNAHSWTCARAAQGPPGNDPNLACGQRPLEPDASCLATGPRPGERGPYHETGEGVSVIYGPGDPPPWTPAVFDPVTRTETILPIPPGYVDWDPGYEAYVPGDPGCVPDPCLSVIEAIIGADTREQITNTTGYPWRCIGLILVTFDNGKTYEGTGALVGPRHVLTCGHNLHDKSEPGVTDPWAKTFAFYPGQTSMTRPRAAGGTEPNPNARPYGSATWTNVYLWTAWTTERDRDFDMMLVILDKPLGNRTGWFGRSTGGTDLDQWRQLSGYPGDKALHEQWWAGGTVSAETTYQIRYDNDSVAGHSGSPVWYYSATDDQRYIRGVHIGDRSATAENPNRGVLLNRGKYETISSWIAANPVALMASAPCDDCGPDCNANGIPDSQDVAGGTSEDSNDDGVPDECQLDVLQPADQISCEIARSTVRVGAMDRVTANVLRDSTALANRFVSFSSPTGNVEFLDGLVGSGGATSLATTDASGQAAIRFRPTTVGPGTIRADVGDGALYSECTFLAKPGRRRVAAMPCPTLAFETEDDFLTPLGNGQSISTPPEFGALVSITGSGSNGGPAIFDTTPGGPNDPSLNDDMLIGHGNVLLLQNDWYNAQTVPGFWDVVTDDPDGGDLIFDFTSRVEPRGILLADINPPPNQGATVTLFDEVNRTRTYAVDPGWTGTYGNPGPWRLDLTTLAPQPGNGTPRFARASEMPGFQPHRVVRIVVHLTGFGAVDDLEFCQ